MKYLYCFLLAFGCERGQHVHMLSMSWKIASAQSPPLNFFAFFSFEVVTLIGASEDVLSDFMNSCTSYSTSSFVPRLALFEGIGTATFIFLPDSTYCYDCEKTESSPLSRLARSISLFFSDSLRAMEIFSCILLSM